MNLVDYLKEVPDGYSVKIGASDGTGFFYCGSPEDALENIKQYSMTLKKSAFELLDKAKENLEKTIKKPHDYAAYEKKQKTDELPSFEGYMEFVNGYIKQLQSRLKSIERNKEKTKGFIPLGSREVIEHFIADPLVDKDCYVVIVNGYETGAYWTISEQEGKPHIGLSTAADNEGA